MIKKTTCIFLSILISLLAGISPLILLWRNNLGQIKPAAITRPFLYTIIFILIVYGFWLLVSRSWERSAFYSAVSTLFFFSYGHLYNILNSFPMLKTIGYLKFLLIFFVLFCLCIFPISKIKKFSVFSFMLINILFAALILFNLIPIFSYEIQTSSQKHTSHEIKPVAAEASGVDETQYPDIYYIVLDAYAREDILKDVIGYDNSLFLKEMKDRHFYVPECAFSNYQETGMTIGSVLNFDYMNNLKKNEPNSDEVSVESSNLILDSYAPKYFDQFGYKFVTGRGYTSYLDILNSDVYLNYFKNKGSHDELDQNSFFSMYLNTTVYRVITEIYASNPEKFQKLPIWLPVKWNENAELQQATFWYYQNKYMFDSLEKIPAWPGHYLVYAHIYSPHIPYIYRSDGSFRFRVPSTIDEEKQLYADAVTYLNKRVLELVDSLQKNSLVQPIIIIQGDHSIHNLTSELNKQKILSIFYLPGILNTPLYPTITPVNDFRIIIRNYFDPKMELLPDTLYVKWADNDKPVLSSCDLE